MAWLQAKVNSAVRGVGLNAALAASAANLLGQVLDFSVGTGVAYVLDGIDASKRNGRVQF